jgi:hypothetical protein
MSFADNIAECLADTGTKGTLPRSVFANAATGVRLIDAVNRVRAAAVAVFF